MAVILPVILFRFNLTCRLTKAQSQRVCERSATRELSVDRLAINLLSLGTACMPFLIVYDNQV